MNTISVQLTIFLPTNWFKLLLNSSTNIKIDITILIKLKSSPSPYVFQEHMSNTAIFCRELGRWHKTRCSSVKVITSEILHCNHFGRYGISVSQMKTDLYLQSCGVNQNQAVCFLRLKVVIPWNILNHEMTNTWLVNGQCGGCLKSGVISLQDYLSSPSIFGWVRIVHSVFSFICIYVWFLSLPLCLSLRVSLHPSKLTSPVYNTPARDHKYIVQRDMITSKETIR